MIELRLTHPVIDFAVDVRLLESEGPWLAAADLASAPEVAAAARPDFAAFVAVWPVRPALARRMTTGAVPPGGAASV